MKFSPQKQKPFDCGIGNILERITNRFGVVVLFCGVALFCAIVSAAIALETKSEPYRSLKTVNAFLILPTTLSWSSCIMQRKVLPSNITTRKMLFILSVMITAISVLNTGIMVVLYYFAHYKL